MSMAIQPFAFDLVLPWHKIEEQEQKFHRTLKGVLIPVILLFLLIPWLKLIKIEHLEGANRIVETRIVLEPVAPKEIEKPVIVEAPIVPTEQPTLIETPKVAEVPKSKVISSPKKNDAPKVGTPGAPSATENKVSVAASQGLGELSSQLKSLRGSLDIAKMQNKNVTEGVGGAAARSERDVLGGENAVKKSKGIVVNEAAMKGGAVGLADHKSTVVEGSGDGGDANGVPDGRLSHLSGQVGKRDMESIRRTLEQAKSNVYTLYQRALLTNPNVAGKFTFKIVIEPNGSISSLILIASELGLPDLEKNILAKIQQVNFGAKDVSSTVIEYKFVFLPN